MSSWGTGDSWGCAPNYSTYFRSICWSDSVCNMTNFYDGGGQDAEKYGPVWNTSGTTPTLSQISFATGENFYLDWQIESFYSYNSSNINYDVFKVIGYAKIDYLYATVTYSTTGSPITGNTSVEAAYPGCGDVTKNYLPLSISNENYTGQSLSSCPIWSDTVVCSMFEAYMGENPYVSGTDDFSKLSGEYSVGSVKTSANSQFAYNEVYNGQPFMQERTLTAMSSIAEASSGSDTNPWNGYCVTGSTINLVPYSDRYTINRHSASSVTYLTTPFSLTISQTKFVENNSTALLTVPYNIDKNSILSEGLYYYQCREYVCQNPSYYPGSVFLARSPIEKNMNVAYYSLIRPWHAEATASGYASQIHRPVICKRSGSSSSPSSAPSGKQLANKKEMMALSNFQAAGANTYNSSSETTNQHEIQFDPSDTYSTSIYDLYNYWTTTSTTNSTTTIDQTVELDGQTSYSSITTTLTLIQIPYENSTILYSSASRLDIDVTCMNNTETDETTTFSLTVSYDNKIVKITSSNTNYQLNLSYTYSSVVDSNYGAYSDTTAVVSRFLCYSGDFAPTSRLLRGICYDSISIWAYAGDNIGEYNRNHHNAMGSRWVVRSDSNGQDYGLATMYRMAKTRQMTDSVRLSYKSCAHNVLVLGLDDGYATLMPVTEEISSADFSFYSVANKGLAERKIRYQSLGNVAYNTIPIVEVSRAPLDTNILITNSWILCGPAVDIQSGGDTTLSCTEGDSYYQSWDCYHCGPYSSTSINSIIDTFKVPLESWTNLHGRYDVYKDVNDLSGVDMDSFFLVNEVYSQQNNLMTYNYHTSTQNDSVDEYPTSIVWSSAMAYGIDNDPWSEVYLTNMAYMDGNCGQVNSLNLFNGNLYCFQDRGLSVIKYNENVQLESTAASTISLGNSGVVDGYDLIAKDIGVTDFNKVLCTHENMYFAEHNRQALFQVGREGITNLSDQLGFHSFFQNYDSFGSDWSCFDFSGIRLHYDPENTEVLIQMKDVTLAFNEQLKQFSSFYDYNGYTTLTHINGLMLATAPVDGSAAISSLRTGNYNNFFGVDYDYGVTILPNAEPTKEKTFSNLDMRSDKWTNENIVLTSNVSGTYTAINSGAPIYYILGYGSLAKAAVSDLNIEDGDTLILQGTITNTSEFSVYVLVGTSFVASTSTLLKKEIEAGETVELNESFEYKESFEYLAISIYSSSANAEVAISGIQLIVIEHDHFPYLRRTTFDNIQVWNEFQDSGTKKLTELIPKFSPLKEKFRVWRVQLPRDAENRRDRIKNPWCYIKLSSNTAEDNDNCKFVLHDIDVWYV